MCHIQFQIFKILFLTPNFVCAQTLFSTPKSLFSVPELCLVHYAIRGFIQTKWLMTFIVRRLNLTKLSSKLWRLVTPSSDHQGYQTKSPPASPHSHLQLLSHCRHQIPREKPQFQVKTANWGTLLLLATPLSATPMVAYNHPRLALIQTTLNMA